MQAESLRSRLTFGVNRDFFLVLLTVEMAPGSDWRPLQRAVCHLVLVPGDLADGRSVSQLLSLMLLSVTLRTSG